MSARKQPYCAQSLPAAEFFAGIGFMRRAMETASGAIRWKTVFANDNDPTKARIYKALFPSSSAHLLRQDDVAALKWDEIPPCDLWTVSFPCTDVSLAGGRRGIYFNQSAAVWKVLRLLEETPNVRKPRVVLFENVMGLLSSFGGEDFFALIAKINECGYTADPIRVDARHFVPQSRQRLFIVARRYDQSRPMTSQGGVDKPNQVRPAQILQAMRRRPDLRWETAHLPPLPKLRRRLPSILDELPLDRSQWWSSDRVRRFCDQVHPNHRAAAERLRTASEIRYVTAFRRVRRFGELKDVKKCVAELRFDGIAGCLRTPKGGSAKQILVRLGQGQVHIRHLTPAECMRLQGWNRHPPPNVSYDDMLFALGDAVCVPAVQWALRHAIGPPTAIRSTLQRSASHRHSTRLRSAGAATP